MCSMEMQRSLITKKLGRTPPLPPARLLTSHLSAFVSIFEKFLMLGLYSNESC